MKKRTIGVILAAVLLVAVIAAVVVPKMGQAASAGPGGAPLTVVTGVIGSEKKEFFDDPKVKAAFAAHGYDVQVTTAGSRQIATSPALASADFAFPSSAPAAEKIKQGSKNVKGTYPTFYSPMAVATFKPVVQLLKNAGMASQDAAGTWHLDMKAYLAAVAEGKRWNQIPGAAAPTRAGSWPTSSGPPAWTSEARPALRRPRSPLSSTSTRLRPGSSVVLRTAYLVSSGQGSTPGHVAPPASGM
jgi:hypothetical protein